MNKSGERTALLVAGLGWGDEGKGTTVDYLVRKYGAHTVVRYNGGGQAGHTVVTEEGRRHVFAQFSSGTLVPGVKTHLSRFMRISPLSMMNEEEHLRMLGIYDAFLRTTIDEHALIVTPFQRAANRLKEIARGEHRYGSCGMGIGQTALDHQKYGDRVLYAKDLCDREATRTKLRFLQKANYEELLKIRSSLPSTEQVKQELWILEDRDVIEEYAQYFLHFGRIAQIVDEDYLSALLHMGGTIVFEGAQGVLLDEQYGFYPFITKTDTTFANALTLLQESKYAGEIKRTGVLRGYATRHGEGPFVSGDAMLTGMLQESTNQENEWQRKFKVGFFDLVAARYALNVIKGVDSLVFTNLDRMVGIPTIQVCNAYDVGIKDETCFLYNSRGRATAIKVMRPPNIERQKILASLLTQAKPVYEPYSPFRSKEDAQRYALYLAQCLKTPVGILSFGPTAREKIEA